MQNQPSPTAVQKNLQDNLMKAQATRGALSEQIENVDKQILGMRNALEGITLGMKLLAERQAAEAAQKEADENADVPELK